MNDCKFVSLRIQCIIIIIIIMIRKSVDRRQSICSGYIPAIVYNLEYFASNINAIETQ